MAEKECPVCHGTGFSNPLIMITTVILQICWNCGGSGYVEDDEDEEEEY